MPAAPSSRPLAGRVAFAIAAAILAGLVWRFPLVRFRRLDQVATVAAFDPRAYAERFWTDDLVPAFATAKEVDGVVAAVRSDPGAACRSLGRSPGLSRTCLYLVRGSGTISDVGPMGCRVNLTDDAGEVELLTGLVFGTGVRDVTGTVDPASRTDSRELAAVASEINRLVQERAIAPLKAGAAAGRPIEFVACGQVQGTLPEGKPWKLIPVQVTLQEAPGASEGFDVGDPSTSRVEATPYPLASARGLLWEDHQKPLPQKAPSASEGFDAGDASTSHLHAAPYPLASARGLLWADHQKPLPQKAPSASEGFDAGDASTSHLHATPYPLASARGLLGSSATAEPPR